jgi:hypothetical protein
MSLDLDDFDAPVVEIQVAKPAGPVAPSAAASTSTAPAVAVAPPSPSSSFSQAVATAKTESKKAISQFGKEYGPDIVGALNPVHYNEQGPQDYTNIDWALTLPHAAVEAVGGLGVGLGLTKRISRMVAGQSSFDKEKAKQYAEQTKISRERLELDKQQIAREAKAAQTAQQAPVPVKPTPILKMGPMSLATAVGGAPGGAPGAPFTAPPPAQSSPPVGQAPAAVAPTAAPPAAPDLPPALAPTEPTSPFSPPARVADVPATTVDVAKEIGPAVDTPDKVASAGQQTTPPAPTTTLAETGTQEPAKLKRSEKKIISESTAAKNQYLNLFGYQAKAPESARSTGAVDAYNTMVEKQFGGVPPRNIPNDPMRPTGLPGGYQQYVEFLNRNYSELPSATQEHVNKSRTKGQVGNVEKLIAAGVPLSQQGKASMGGMAGMAGLGLGGLMVAPAMAEAAQAAKRGDVGMTASNAAELLNIHPVTALLNQMFGTSPQELETLRKAEQGRKVGGGRGVAPPSSYQR